LGRSIVEERRKKAIDLFIELGIPKTLAKSLAFLSESKTNTEDELEERNDVCIYKTLRYPPKSTPPTAT
jgi:predicted transcriptional regulator